MSKVLDMAIWHGNLNYGFDTLCLVKMYPVKIYEFENKMACRQSNETI